jgi:hypothetical protein
MVQVSMLGHSPTIAANLLLRLYRGTVNVANCATFIGSPTSVGAIDLSTAAMVTAFTDVDPGVVLELSATLVDNSVGDVFAWGAFAVQGSYFNNSGGIVPVPTPGTGLAAGVYGNRYYDGSFWYVYSATDDLWHKETAVGTGDQIHYVLADTGIAIP